VKTFRNRTSANRAHTLAQPAVLPEARSIEYVLISQLRPYPNNPRTHTRKGTRKLAAVIERYGFQSPVIINEQNVILAGHGRVEAARELGMLMVPCLRAHGLSAAEQRAYVLADNRLSEESSWDLDLLAGELETLAVENPDIDLELLTGFDTGEIDDLLVNMAENDADPSDQLPSMRGPIVTRPGDLWLFSGHRLFCGDSREPQSYTTLTGGVQSGMAITDPPFNVKVRGHVSGRGKVKHDEFAFASGEMSDREFKEFLVTTISHMAAACVAGALIYVFQDWRHVRVLAEVGEELNLELRNICVWSKTTPGQGSFYRSAHELVFVFQKPGASAQNNIALGKYGRSRSNVWTYAPPNKFAGKDDDIRGHPTPKPVALVAEAIKDASKRRGIVLDPFVGSGTVFLAAEKVGRIAYGIEFEPRYVDLSIRRWQDFARKDVILAGTDKTFEQVAEERGGRR
jgi:DNA modification methylase